MTMDSCKRCELSELGNKDRVCIPRPSKEIRGCLISRDPTSDFLNKLTEYKQLSTENKGILWFNAPPCWLFTKIEKIIKRSSESFPNKTKLPELQNFLNYECYWTHLHKCPTKPQKNLNQYEQGINSIEENYPSFRFPTAKYCADNWFKPEFDKYNLNDKIIITVGRDVEKYFNSWSNNCGLDSKRIINFPHPSGRCRSWNQNSDQKERITDEINRLLNLI